MAFPDFPFPSHWKSYVRHDQVHQYLQDYAQHFDLFNCIQFNTLVERVHPAQDSSDDKTTWEVTVKEIQKGTRTTHLFDAVVVCNG